MDDRFAELLEQFDDGLRNGHELPSSPGGLVEPDGDLRQKVADAAECLRLIERVRRRWQDSATNIAPVSADYFGPAAQGERLRIGRFEILKELGRGGHGIVFLAWDPAARRRIALKTPRPNALFTEDLRSRFLREGIAAARLAHPNIVSVLEVDQSGPVCYIVSAYSEGKSLATLLAENKEPIAVNVAAEWMAALADGVEHAHCHGILHRDLKPANVVLEPAPVGLAAETHSPVVGSSLVPKLTDFGLAKLLDSDDARTRTGAMLGTPAYMAPEQVDASVGTIGPATDVYGLGAILYELLAGKPPFTADSQADLLRQIASEDPRNPREQRRDLPRDLEAICLRCLQRRPQDRYRSAAALAADLRRFRAGEVTWARPLGFGSRALKWSRRRPATAAAVAVTIIASLIVSVGAAWHFVQMGQALQIAEAARTNAEQRGRELQQLIYFRDLQGAYEALQQQDIRKASNLLARHEGVAETDQRGFLWRHLWARCHGQPRRLMAHRGHAHSVDFTPDGQFLVSAGADGTVRIWDASSGDPRATLGTGANEVNFACYSPDGKMIAAAENGAQVRLWDAADGRLLSTWACAELQDINCLAWSGDGRHLAAAGSPGALLAVWDQETGPCQTIPIGHTDEINRLVYSPDGRLLTTASSDETVIVWDLEQNKPLARLEPEQTHVTCVQFSPDGQYLATSGVKGTVKIWTVTDWSLAATYETNSERVDAVVFSPHNPVVAFGDHFGIVREWDWKLDRVSRAIDSGQGRILSLAYSPAANTLATAARDGSVCIWDFTGQELVGDLPSGFFSKSVTFSADSGRLISANYEGRIAIFDMQKRTTETLSHTMPNPIGGTTLMGPHTVATLAHDFGTVYGWDLAAQVEPSTFAASQEQIAYTLVTPDGTLLLTGDNAEPSLVRLWDAVSGRQLAILGEDQFHINCMACTRSGDIAASASSDNIRLWDLRGRKLLRTLDTNRALAIAFSSDGRTLASAGDEHQVRFWDTDTGQPSRLVLSHVFRVKSLAFCPDEPLLATGDEAGFVRLWCLPSGEELMVLGQLRDQVDCLAFSPDGCWLAAGTDTSSRGRQMRVWNAPK